MTENEQKQQLSMAYVQAVAARAGYSVVRPPVDDDSVDIQIRASGRTHPQAPVRSPCVDVQLKSTAQDMLRDDHLAFPLPLKNYNDLRERSLVPRYLVVLLLPTDTTRWLEQSEESMISRSCAYWTSLLGMGETENLNRVTVRLPRVNLFTVDQLHSLMERASRPEPL